MYRMQKNSILNLHEVIGRTKTKIYCQGIICWRCILPSNWVWRRLANKQNHWSILKKKLYHHHHKHQGLGHLAHSVSRFTAALTNVSSVSQLLFSFLVDYSGMNLKGFGFVAFFAGVRASSFCIHLFCLVFCTNLEQMFIHTGHQPPYTADDNTAETGMCACQLFLILLVVCWEIHLLWRKNLEPHKCVHCSQININMERFTWAKLTNISGCMVQHMATSGKRRAFIMHVFWTDSVQIIVHLLLSTVTYRQLVHLQWKGTAQAKDVQFLCCNFMRKFYSILRRMPPQAPLWLVTQLVWIIILCGMLYTSSISKMCSLY
jgi:hypothetical protein